MKGKKLIKQFKEEWKTLPKPRQAFIIFTWLFVLVFFSLVPKAIYDNHMTTECLKSQIEASCSEKGGNLIGYNIWVISLNRTHNNSLNITPDYYCKIDQDYFKDPDHFWLTDNQIEKCQRG